MQYIVLWIGVILCSVSLLSILTVTTILAGHTEVITRLPKAYPGTLVTIKQYNILRLVICILLSGLQWFGLRRQHTRLSGSLLALYVWFV